MRGLWGKGAKLSAITGVAVAALALSACGEDDPGDKNECAVNKDCPGEQICDENKQCVDKNDGKECTKASDCPGDKVCNDDFQCVEPGGSGDLCTDDEDCADGEVCSADKKCVDDPGQGPECTKNDECAAGEFCNDDQECEEIAATCGDGVIDEDQGEECDDGENNSDTVPNACRENCKLPSCGDGVIDDGEECDDGPEGSETCASTCELIETENFRWTSIAIQEPDVYVQALDPECEESQRDSLLNDTLAGMIKDPDPEEAEDEDDLKYELSINQALPLPLTEGAAADGTLSVPECRYDETAGKLCEAPLEENTSDWIFTRATSAGKCFARVPKEANAQGWIDHPELDLDETLIPTNDNGQCILGESQGSFDLSLNILGVAQVDIILNGAHMAYELDDARENVRNGMLAGFLTHEDADQEVLGLLNDQDLFNSGSDASCFDYVPLDKGPNADGEIVDGWWIYIAFEGDNQVAFVD